MGRPNTERSKIVVKNLPPSLSEDAFVTAIDAVCKDTYTTLRYVPGKTSAKSSRPSRAYLYMKDPLLVYDVRASFDGHAFINEKGQQYRCSVEYAPYQKAPKVVLKKDPREGTLDKDPGYQEFLAHLEKDPYTAFSKVRQGEDNTAVADNQMKLTNSEGKRMSALMVYLQKKWAGALETNMDSRRSSNRQKGRGRVVEVRGDNIVKVRKREDKVQAGVLSSLAPPPGFSALPHSVGESSTRKPSQQSKSGDSREASLSDKKADSEGQRATGRSAVRIAEIPKPGKGKSPKPKTKSGDKAITVSSEDAQKQAKPTVGPRRIFRKEDSESAASAASAKAKDDDQPQRARISEGGEAKKRASRPVRAGYQPYTPKVRAATQPSRE